MRAVAASPEWNGLLPNEYFGIAKRQSARERSPPMSTVTIAVDLAKNVFEIAVAAEAGAIREHRRLSRAQFEHFWRTCANCRVVMEACSGSHFWARELTARGFDVTLLPPHRSEERRVGEECKSLG